MRSYLSGLMENWLFAPTRSTCMRKRDYVAILLEMYQFCPRYAARRACQLNVSARMSVNF
jgi:TetR/AcrR family acrAB operon transcriptional repressor